MRGASVHSIAAGVPPLTCIHLHLIILLRRADVQRGGAHKGGDGGGRAGSWQWCRCISCGCGRIGVLPGQLLKPFLGAQERVPVHPQLG